MGIDGPNKVSKMHVEYRVRRWGTFIHKNQYLPTYRLSQNGNSWYLCWIRSYRNNSFNIFTVILIIHNVVLTFLVYSFAKRKLLNCLGVYSFFHNFSCLHITEYALTFDTLFCESTCITISYIVSVISLKWKTYKWCHINYFYNVYKIASIKSGIFKRMFENFAKSPQLITRYPHFWLPHYYHPTTTHQQLGRHLINLAVAVDILLNVYHIPN